MKLKLETYDYEHLKYLTYVQHNTSPFAIQGTASIYWQVLEKSDRDLVVGSLDDISFPEGSGDSTYIEIPQNEWIELSFKNADSFLSSIGEISASSPTTGLAINFRYQGEGASSQLHLDYDHPDGAYLLDINKTPGTSVTVLSQGVSIGAGFSVSRLMEFRLKITNNSAGAEWIRIYDCFWTLSDTAKSGIATKTIYANYGNRATYNPSTRTVSAREAIVPIYRPSKEVTWDGDNIFATGTGRMYERWIDSVSGGARSNGRNEGDVIHQPTGIAESLLRDEIFVERDLTLERVSDNTFYINDLRIAVNDYYDYAIIYNVTRNEKDYVADFVYTGGNKRINTSSAHSGWQTGDLCYLTNIQGDIRINYQSFDLLNNTTNGLRKDWRFVRSIYQEEHPESLLTKLLYESRCFLFTSHNQYKIVAIQEDSGSVDTWTTPLKRAGKYLARARLTPLSNFYNDFRVHYDYDYGESRYRKNLYVNKNGYSPQLSNGSDQQDVCKAIYDNYSFIRKFEYYCDWIKVIDSGVGGSYDYWTVAEYFFEKIFKFYSKQRLIVEWSTPVSDYLQYEVGDQVILNNTDLIPTGINNSSKFMIIENPIIPLPGAPIINFKLLEMTDDAY